MHRRKTNASTGKAAPWFLLLALLLPYGTFAQLPEREVPVYYLSLKECVAYALENRQAIQEARFDKRKAKADVDEIFAMAYPQLSASWDLKWFLEIPAQPLPAIFVNPQASEDDFIEVAFGTEYQSTAGVNLQQLIFDGTFFLGVKASKQVVDLMQKNILRTEIEAVAEVSKAYYSVLVNRERLELLRANIRQIEETLQTTEAMYENGFVEEIDVKRLRVSLNNLKSELSNAEAMVELSVELLKFQTGLDPQIELELTTELSDEELDIGSLLALEADPRDRIEYRILQNQVQLQQINERRYRANYLPKLYGQGNLATQRFSNQFDIFDTSERWFPNAFIGLQLNWTVFDGFRNATLAEKAVIEQERLQSQADQFLRSVNLQTKQAQIELQNALRNLEMQQENLELAEEVYRVTMVKYREGVGNNMEVVEAETQLSQAQTNYSDAKLQAYVARVDLLQALGALYDPLTAEEVVIETNR